MKSKNYLIDEFGSIYNFVKTKDFDFSVYRRQLRSLWTTYCIHHNINKNSPEIDQTRFLYYLWNNIASKDNSDWTDENGKENYELFRDYMTADLE